jgi:hypothetical protein
MPTSYNPDGVNDCQGTTPLPPPTWSLASGPMPQEALAFLRPIFPSPWPASSLIQYTLDGAQPVLPQNYGPNSPFTMRHWTLTDTNMCSSMALYVPQFDAPLICRARLLNEAICPTSAVSPTVTRVYVPEGYIREPDFERLSNYGASLRIHMRTGYPASYPDGYAFVAYTLDGTTPGYGPEAPNGVNSPVWTDWNDNNGATIPIFTDAQQQVVTLKARNYLLIGGTYVPGPVVEWSYPRL